MFLLSLPFGSNTAIALPDFRPGGAMNRTRNITMRSLLVSLRWVGVGLLGLTVATGCGGNNQTYKTSSTGQASGGERRVIILINGNSPFWDTCRAGLLEAEKDLKLRDVGLRAVLEVNDGTPQGQLNKLRQFASQSDVAAIGISAIDAA